MRWELYAKIKKITRDRQKSVDNYYLTRNELKSVINSLDVYQLRLDVFKLYQIPVENPILDPPHEILMRAHYTYIFDTEFDKKIQNLKEKHEKYVALLLENIEFCKELEDLYEFDR